MSVKPGFQRQHIEIIIIIIIIIIKIHDANLR